MKILVTGANGLLGGRTIRHLADEHEVHAVVRLMPQASAPGVRYHEIDLASAWEPSQLPPQLDVIIHLAQSSRFREFPEQAADVFNVNVASTARLLDHARMSGVRSFVLASSGGVYGAGDEAFAENSLIPHHRELGFYLGSKLCAEVLAHNYASWMSVSVLRPFFMYGSGQKRSMLVPRLIDSIATGQAISLQGPEGIRINPIHVSDALAALVRCIDLKDSNTFNVAGPQVLSLREIAETIGRFLKKAPKFSISEARPNHLVANIDALCKYLVEPTVRFEQGVLELLP